MKNAKILITGPTSQVALPLARSLARDNEVYGLARLSKTSDREKLEEIGVRPLAADLATDDFEEIPDDFTYVLNFAVLKTGDFAYDLAANAEGVGRLMARCREAKAFLHCSSAAVYAEAGRVRLNEDAALGDSHRSMFPTYSTAKIAAETVVRFASRQWNVPTTIARFSVPYGDNGGWPLFHLLMMRAGEPIPVPPDPPAVYNPIHEDDYIGQIPKLLEIASVPATTVNWGGDPAALQTWCEYIGEIAGLTARFVTTKDTIPSLELDLTRLHRLVGPTRVGWKEGIRRLVETHSR